MMIDRYGRIIDYLRFSVTQRCQQHCLHCFANGADGKNASEPTVDEIHRLLRIFGNLGFRKLRFTGGEPLLRCDITDIVNHAFKQGVFDDIALTTNALLLSDLAQDLKKSGLSRVNISLNTLKEDRFYDYADASIKKVFNGIEAVFSVGLLPLKLNVVLLKGINDDEISDFINLTKEYPLDIRFIELMPMGNMKYTGVSGEEILASFPSLLPVRNDQRSVADCYSLPGAHGNVGFINPISSCFCQDCSRMRVTSDLKLRPCLGDNAEYDISAFLQKDDDTLQTYISDIIYNKPQCNSFSKMFVTNRTMNRLGG